MTTILLVTDLVENLVVIWANLILGILACQQLRKLRKD